MRSDLQSSEALFWERNAPGGHGGDVGIIRQNTFTGVQVLYSCSSASKYKQQMYEGSRSSTSRIHENPEAMTKALGFPKDCPFCPGRERACPTDVLRIEPDGALVHCERGEAGTWCTYPGHWKLRCIRNTFPIMLSPSGWYGSAADKFLGGEDGSSKFSPTAIGEYANDSTNPRTACGIQVPEYPQVDARGFTEVIVETPVHNTCPGIAPADHMQRVLSTMVIRGKVLIQHPMARHIVLFKQQGSLSGGSLPHAHSQIITLPVVPVDIENRVLRCLIHWRRKQESLPYEHMVRAPTDGGAASARLVHVSSHFVVSLPYAHEMRYHINICPKRRSAEFFGITDDELQDLAATMQLMLETIYFSLDDPSYHMSIETCPVLSKNDESIREDLEKAFCWYACIQPRFATDVGGFTLASTVPLVKSLPEDDAAFLRSVVEKILEHRSQYTMVERLRPFVPNKGLSWEEYCVSLYSGGFNKGDQQNVYNVLACEYLNDAEAMSEVRSMILKRCFGNLDPQSSFLDVGCGVGECLRLLSVLGFEDGYGIDFAPEMVIASRQKQLRVHLLDFETQDIPSDWQWPTKFDAVYGFAFIHMFPVIRAATILRKMFVLARKRVFISTTLHTEDTEGMIPKQMGNTSVVRFRHEYSHEAFLELAKTCCPSDWNIRWWWMADPKNKRWVCVLFYHDCGGIPDCQEIVKYDLSDGVFSIDCDAPCFK